MSQGKGRTTVRRRRRLLFGLAGLTSLAVAMGPGTAVADDPSSCPDTKSCAWGQPNYDGQRDVIDGSYGGTGWRDLYFNHNSAKNRFNARKLRIGRVGDGFIQVVACLDPGENRPDPGPFDAFWVSDVTNDKCGPG
jgi:hypothetical protein